MQRRKLGPFEVSELGLGCMNMSMGYGPADDGTSRRLLPAALDAGYSFLDTASMYGMGHNESLIGRALKGRRNEYVLASKCGLTREGNNQIRANGRPEVLKRTCEESLRRLQTEVIDLYYLHRLDPDVPVEESVGALADLVREGKIQTIGLSEVSAATLRRAHATYPITAVQSEYSLWTRTPERRMLSACRERGVTFVPFSPLGRGFLTGKAQDVTRLAEDDIRQNVARPRFEPDNFEANSKLLEPLAELAGRAHCTLAQLALVWLLAQQDETLIPIPGTKHIEYMGENAGAADICRDDELVREIDSLFPEERVAGARYNETLMATIDSEKD